MNFEYDSYMNGTFKRIAHFLKKNNVYSIAKDGKKLEFSFSERPDSGHRNYVTKIDYTVAKQRYIISQRDYATMIYYTYPGWNNDLPLDAWKGILKDIMVFCGYKNNFVNKLK